MRAALALIWTITASATVLQAANGLLQALLPLRMQAQGLSITAIGVVAAGYGVGFSAGCLFVPVLVRHVGHIRAFASLAAVATVIMLVFTQVHTAVAWTGLRILSGMALAGLFTITDSWTSARATAGNRGRIISIYMICTKIALVVSPLGVGLGDITGDGLFMGVAALMCLSLLPVAATVSEEPPLPQTVRLHLKPLFGLAPSAVVGAFAVGLMNGPVMAMTPVYGTGIGLSPDRAATLLLALQGGSLLFQWPLGWLSDRLDRRIVIAGLAAGTAAVSVVIAWASAHVSGLILILGFLGWGGTALCIYAVCVAHACDLVAKDRIVPTVSGLLVCWATGMMVGPIPCAALMQAMGPQGLFVYATGISLALAGFVVFRMARIRRGPHRGFFGLWPTSPATGALSPRAQVPSPSAAPPSPPERASTRS